jgi:hypothetical protein
MSRTRLIATAAGIAALLISAPTAQAVTCDGLDGALGSAGDGDVVTLDEGQVCHGHFDLPNDTTITQQGGGTGATLDGDSETQIRSVTSSISPGGPTLSVT